MMSRLCLFGLLAAIALTGCARRIPVHSGDIVYLGDSITAGYGLDASQAYPALIQIPGMTMVNLGVSGSRTTDGLQRLKDYLGAHDAPRLVVIALGANDILNGVSEDTISGNLNNAIATCQQRGVPVFLCGIRIPFKFDTDGIFEGVASKNHVPLLPDLMQGEQNDPSMLQSDGMHPTADGQKLIAEKLQEALLRFFKFGP